MGWAWMGASTRGQNASLRLPPLPEISAHDSFALDSRRTVSHGADSQRPLGVSQARHPRVLALSDRHAPPSGAIGRVSVLSARRPRCPADADRVILARCCTASSRQKGPRTSGRRRRLPHLHAATTLLLDGCGVAEPEPEPYEEWMAAMRFKTAKDNGATPASRLSITPSWRVAPIWSTRYSTVAHPSSANAGRMCPPGASCGRISAHRRSLRARGSSSSYCFAAALTLDGGFPLDTALLAATISGNIEGVRALMRHDATLADRALGLGCLPFFQMWATGHAHMLTFLRNEYPRQLEATVRDVDTARIGGFGLCAYAIANNAAHPELLTVTLDLGEPVDRYAPKVKGFFRPIVRLRASTPGFVPSTSCRSLCSLSYLFRSSALHFAAYFGHLPGIDFLIAHGADIHSAANPKRMTHSFSPPLVGTMTSASGCWRRVRMSVPRISAVAPRSRTRSSSGMRPRRGGFRPQRERPARASREQTGGRWGEQQGAHRRPCPPVQCERRRPVVTSKNRDGEGRATSQPNGRDLICRPRS